MKAVEINVSRSISTELSEKDVVLAFFSVVASYSNLSTFIFSGAKIKVFCEYGI